MTSKNLNDCNGTIVINNDHNISLPAVYKTNSYDINFQQPCFFINNHYITPLLRCYNVILPNPISIEKCDRIRIKIKIPKQIFGTKYGYSLDNLHKELQNDTNFCVGLRLKSSDGCINIRRYNNEPEQLTIKDYCGWIVITIQYTVGDKDGPAINAICNLCEIAYSICFDPVKIKSLYGTCNGHDNEIVNFTTQTCLELENRPALRVVDVDFLDKNESNNDDYKLRIVGPEDFLCLKIEEKDSSPIYINFDKFTKTLTIKGNFSDNTSDTNTNTLEELQEALDSKFGSNEYVVIILDRNNNPFENIPNLSNITISQNKYNTRYYEDCDIPEKQLPDTMSDV